MITKYISSHKRLSRKLKVAYVFLICKNSNALKSLNLKLTILFTVLLFSCKSFSQVPIVWGDTNVTVPEDFQSSGNYYYKDIPNHLLNFTGTWEYVNGNEKFQIVLSKVTKHHTVVSHALFNFNFYEDGIVLQYKKYVNNLLIFESPVYQSPNFKTTDGITLIGSVTDYARVTKTIYYPQFFQGGGVQKQGGEYFYPTCYIEKLPKIKYEPHKIKFQLFMQDACCGETQNEIYNGLPTFSIPDNIEMVKLN